MPALPDGPSSNAWGVKLASPTIVRHQGLLVLFAREVGSPTDTLYFQVFDPYAAVGAPDASAWNGWYRFAFPEAPPDPAAPVLELRDPARLAAEELRPAGMDLLTVEPVVASVSPADAPFEVVSDDRHLYCFRPSVSGALYLTRLVLTSMSDEEGEQPGVRYEMTPAWEVRYQRSGQRDVPLDDTDTASAVDLAGVPFFEPTIEVADVSGATAGRMSVTRVPTGRPGRVVWYVAVSGPDAVRLVRFDQSDETLTDFTTPPVHYTPIAPGLVGVTGSAVPLTVSQAMAPELLFCAEQDQVVSEAGDAVELQRQGRLMLAVPVSGAGLVSAMAVYDYSLGIDGAISDLAPAQQGVRLVDGTIEDGSFVPDRTSPEFPTQAQAADCVQVVDGLVVNQMLLGQVAPATSPAVDPVLYAGDDGLVHLYYGGPPPTPDEDEITGWHSLVPGVDQAMVAQFDPRVSRLVLDVPWRRLEVSEQPVGAVHFTARQAGAIMAGSTVEVRDATFLEGGETGQADLCDIVLTYPPASALPTETWVGVPRETTALVATLNGGATDDSADAALGTGTKPYFDFDGEHPLVRLPLTIPGEAAAALPSYSYLATVRTTARLKEATTTVAGDKTELRITFNHKAAGEMVQVWPNLPTEIAEWPQILDGSAAPSDYDYTPGPDSTPVFGLPTSSAQVLAPLLLVPTAPRPQLSSLTIDVRRSQHVELVDVTFAGVGQPFTVRDLPTDVQAFATTLERDAEFAALGLVIDRAGVAGAVLTTRTPVGALDLREAACLFDYWCPAGVPATSRARAGVAAAGRQRHTAGVGDPRVRTAMVGFVASADPSEAGVAAYLVNQAAGDAAPRVTRRLGAAPVAEAGSEAVAVVPRSGVWLRQVAQNACRFGPTDSLEVPVLGNSGQPLPRGARLRPSPRFTIEAWAQPTGAQPRRLVTFSDQVTAVPRTAPQLDYRVALEGQHVVTFGSYAKDPGRPDSTYAVTGQRLDVSPLPKDAFTWEVWVQPEAVAAPQGSNPTPIGGIVQVGVPTDAEPALSIGLRADRHVVVAVSADGRSVTEHVSAAAIAHVDEDGVPQWSHLAVVAEHDDATGAWTIGLHVNAVLDSTFSGIELPSQPSQATITIGRNDVFGASVYGRLAQLRLWSTRRTLAEIRTNAFVVLDGTEPGLLGYWMLTTIEPGPGIDGHFANRAVRTDTDRDWNATIMRHRQPLDTQMDNFFVSVVASVGGLDPVKADALLASGRWNHIAVEFEAGGALELNTDETRTRSGRYDWMTCAHSDSLVAASVFAIDAWIVVPTGSAVGGTIASRWSWDGDKTAQSFRLKVTEDGELTLDAKLVTDDLNAPLSIAPTSSGAGLADGRPHHVAVVFATQADPSGEASTWTATFYRDGDKVGAPTGQQKRTSIEVVSTQVDFLVGRGVVVPTGAKPQSIDSLSLFHGTIGRLRFWRVAPSVETLFPERSPQLPRFGPPTGLVAQWDFLEQAGQVVVDSIGGNDGTLTSSAPWRLLRSTSAMRFFANGSPVATTEPYKGSLQAAASSGFWLGAPSTDVAGVAGDVAQVTLWDTLRSLETIQDQLYVPRTGGEPSMLAGWTFTPGGDDITGGGNDVSPPIPVDRIRPSTAPISNEGAFVRNVYGGRLTELSQSTFDRVAVGSSVDVQQLSGRAPTAVVKRQFAFDADGSFSRPIQIGYLDLVWVGQVQTDPTLIGFIEGAPPVPSENLTRPYYLSPTAYLSYANTTQVSLVQDGGRQVTYTSAVKDTGTLDVKAALGIFGQYSKMDLNLIATSSSGYFLKNNIQAQFVFQGKWGSDTNAAYDAKWSAAQRDTIGTRGDWEPYQSDPKHYLNSQVGRRFVPANVGLALVESLTADLYAVTFAANHAALGTVIVPNPTIPPDRNLLMFPMNPQDTLAGSLDGKIGLVNAPGYSGADRRRGSYFKPNEAYATSAWIDRQREQQRAYADQFGPKERGQRGESSLDDVSGNLPVDFETPPGGDGVVATPHSGIVNRYVWSADGGLHAEAQSYTSSLSKTFTGFRTLAVGAGVKGQGEVYVGVGWAWSLDVLSTHVVDVTVGDTAVVSAGVSLDVSVVGESLLQAYDPDATSPYGGNGTLVPGAAPGKVRQYRFMTFYLPPSDANAARFARIVDPVWKQLSTDPAARTLRELRDDNPVWRVFHRVTYVERVPPPVASRPLFATATSLREPENLEGNAALLRLVAECLDPVAPISHISIGQAVATLMNPAPTGPGEYPVSVLERHLTWWRPFLDRARPGSDGRTPDAAAAAALATLVGRVFDYVYAGYETGVLTRP